MRAAAAAVHLVGRSSDRQRVAALTAVTAAAVVGTADLDGLVNGRGAQAPSAVAAPVTAPARYRGHGVAGLITRVFPPGERRHALAVARCESGLRNVPGARNADGSRDWGIFQLNDGAGQWSRSTLALLGGTPSTTLDPPWNVRAARRLWARRGWQPWTCGRRLGLA